MLKCGINQKEHILEYIGNDYGKCAYLYIDMLKFGFENPNVSVWVQKNEKDEICVVILKYYSGMHIFSREGNFDVDDVCALIKEQNPTMVCAMKETIDKIKDGTSGYEVEIGTVCKLNNLHVFDNIGEDETLNFAKVDEIEEIAKLLITDEALGGSYDLETLHKQLKERLEEKFGRNIVLRKDDGEIVSHSATYAEIGKLAVTSGVFVSPKYRAQGKSKITLSLLCKQLIDEGFDVISYYYIESAKRMHTSVGFEKIGDWAKLHKDA